MSLRTDIHTAFDVITPDIGGMQERVVETAMREARVRQRRRRFMLRLRAPITLVAVLVVIAIVAAAVVGSRLIQGWTGQHPVGPPVGSIGPSLAELEARPWQHPVLTAGQQCAGSEINGVPTPSNAPLWTNPIAGPYAEPWGEYSYGYSEFQDGFTGLLIVRVRDGQTGRNDFFLYDNAGGDSVGTVAISGQTVKRYPEAVFDFSKAKATVNGTKVFKLYEGHLTGWSPCFEWQFDGTYHGQPFVWHWYFYG